MELFKNISLLYVSMGAKSGIICLLIISASMSGCTAEEYCGDVATFKSNHPNSDRVVSALVGLPCERSGPTAVGAICWTVKGTATIYEVSTAVCLGMALGECIDSEGYSGCEEAESILPENLQFAFIVTNKSLSNVVVGVMKEEINEFAPISYVVVDDFSSATWEFTIDEEGNIYHFF